MMVAAMGVSYNDRKNTMVSEGRFYTARFFCATHQALDSKICGG
jgi:hypothetical protein